MFFIIHLFQGCSKMLRCKARKNRIAMRISKYVERCGLRRNAADHGALQGMIAFQQPITPSDQSES
jgi:hypothetical protein